MVGTLTRDRQEFKNLEKQLRNGRVLTTEIRRQIGPTGTQLRPAAYTDVPVTPNS